MNELFTGPMSVRVRAERAALIWSILLAPLSIAAIGLIFKSVTASGLILLIVAGMVYVSIARGRLLGSSVRIDDRQFPEVFAIVERIAARLGIAPPLVFIRDDVFVPIAAVGIGEPYSLMISSQYLEHLREREIAFLVARELGHIAAGHTRLSSLLSASGRENPAVALVFGSWLRRTEYTADRVGLLCGATLEDAIGAISITTFHAIGRRVDMQRLAEQRRELEGEPTLRMGEWIGGMPYATNRIAELARFDQTELARTWRARLEATKTRPAIVPDDAEAVAPPGHVRRGDCATIPRRLTAILIDVIVVTSIINSPFNVTVDDSAPVKRAAAAGATPLLRWINDHVGIIHGSTSSLEAVLGLLVYSAILVGFTGQTLGMMVMELRVVTTRFGRPGLGQSVWRYLAGALSSFTAIALVGLFMRIHPHDYLSRTRVVRSRGVSEAQEPLRLRAG